MAEGHDNFPFEYYGIHFQTFTDDTILPHKKPLRHLLIDSWQINNEYASSRYTFEICMYRDKQAVCDELFAPGRKKLSVETRANIAINGGQYMQ